MANGIAKAGSTAKTFGVELDTLNGYVAAIGTTTRESGTIIGNGLKTIISRMTTLPKSESTLAGVGVAMKDLEGNVRPVQDIIADLAGKWHTLSDEQRQNTSVTLAGRYQLSRFNALMANYSIAVDATETSLNSQGSAMRENEKYMDSLQARTQRMKTAWDTFAISVGETFLKDAIVALTATMTGLVNVMIWLDKHGGAIPIMLGLITAALFLTNKGFKDFIVNTVTATASLFRMPAAAGAARTGILGLTISAQALGVAFRSLLFATGVGVVFFLIAKAVESFTGKMADASKEIDSFADAQDKLNEQNNNLKTLKGLRDEYVTLNATIDKSAEQKSRLATIEQQLFSEFGFSTTALDGQTVSVKENTQAINDRINSMETEAQLERDKLAREYQNDSSQINKDIKEGVNNLAQLREEYAKAEEAIDEFSKKVNSGKKFTFEYETAAGGINSVEIDPNDEKAVQEIENSFQRLRRSADKAKEEFNAADTAYRSNVLKKQEALRATLANYYDTMAAQGEDVPDKIKAAGNAIASAFAQTDISDMEFTDKLPEIFKELQKFSEISPVGITFDENGISDFGQKAKQTSNEVEDLINLSIDLTGRALDKDSVQEFTNEMARMGFVIDSANNDMENMLETGDRLNTILGEAAETSLSMEDLGEKFKEASDYIKPLNELIYEQNAGQKMTSEQIGDLISKYPELASAIEETADGWIVEQSAVEELRDSRLAGFNELLEQQKRGAIAVFNGIASNVKQYGIEIKAIDEVGQALAELDKFRKQLENQNRVKSTAESVEDFFYAGMSDEMKKKIEDAGGPLKKFKDATDSNTQAIQDNMEAYESQYESFQKVEALLDGYKNTLNDTTYGTNAQADAAKEAEEATKNQSKAQEDLNNNYRDTIEILTDLQKSMKKVEDQMDKEARKRERMNANSKEYRDSLLKENELISRKQRLLQQGINDPTQLISTTETTTYQTGTSSSGSASVTAGSKLQNLFAKATELAANDAFDYQKIGGKFQGTFEDFLKKGISDCSQYVQEMYEQFLNITLPRTAAEQSEFGTKIDKKDLQPGDLVFFNTTGKSDTEHVGIYMGDGKFTQMGTKGLTSGSDINNSYWGSRYRSATRISGVDNTTNTNSTTSSGTSTQIGKTYVGKYQKEINSSAQKYNIDPIMLAALIKQESSFNPNAKSSVGAMGLTQLMPSTAKSLGVTNAYDPTQAVDGGAKYLSQLVQKYNGDYELALIAYNAGTSKVDKYLAAGRDLSVLPKETQKYLPKVKENYKALSGGKDTSNLSGGGYVTDYSQMTTQQIIDAAQQATDEYIELGNQYYRNQLAYINSTIGEFEDNVNRFDRLIQDSDRTQSNYVETSQAWRDEEAKQNYYRQQQISLIKKQNTEGAKLVKQNKITSGAYNTQFAENIQRIKDLEQTNAESRTAIFNSRLGEFDKTTESINRELGKSETLMSGMDKSSETYRKELQRQIKLKKQMVVNNKTEIALIKERLKNEKLSAVEREALLSLISSLSLDNFNLNLSVKDLIGSFTESEIEAFTKRINVLNDAMANSKLALSRMTEGSTEWKTEIQKQISLTDRLIKVNDEQIAGLNETLKREDLTDSQRAQHLETLRAYTQEHYNLKFARLELIDQIMNVDGMIANFKKLIEQERDLVLASLEKESEAEDDRHEKRMKDIEKEKDAFNKYINDRIEAMDRANAEDDHEKELAKKYKEREKLTSQMNLWINDDSMEGKKKRKEIQEQLDAINQDIDEFTLQRRRELEKQSLEDQLKDRNEYYDEIEKNEDDLTNKNKKDLEKRKKDTEQTYKDLLEDEEYFLSIRKGLMSQDKQVVLDAVQVMQDRYTIFFDKLASDSSIASEAMRSNLKWAFEQDQKQLTDAKNYTNTGDVNTSKEQKDQADQELQNQKIADWNKYLVNKQKAEKIQLLKKAADPSTIYYKNLDSQFKALQNENQALRVKYKTFPDGSYDTLKSYDVARLQTGGELPAWGEEPKWALLDQSEIILDKQDASIYKKGMEMASNFVNNIMSPSNLMQKVGDWKNAIANKASDVVSNPNSGSNLIIKELNMNVKDKDTGNSILDKMGKAVKRQHNLGIFNN